MSPSKKCLGCGIELSLEINNSGYTQNLDNDYCQACYRLKHYKEVKTHHVPTEIPKIRPNSLVLVVSSVLYLDLLFTYPIKRYQENIKIVYIINQLDLLPSQTNYNYLYERVRREANLYHAPYEDIILFSGIHKQDIEQLKSYLLTYDVDDIYLIGIQNSGKTTIFNALTGQTAPLTDVKAGLTREVISGSFDKYQLHDLPGLYQDNYIHSIMSYQDYRKLIPTKQFKPVIFNLNVKETILISNFLALHKIKGSLGTAVFYFNNLPAKKANYENLLKQLDSNLTFSKQIFKIDKAKKYQITIADIGLIHIEGVQTIELTYPKGLHISIKEAFFL